MDYLYQVRAKDSKGEYYISQCVAGDEQTIINEYKSLGLSVVKIEKLFPLTARGAMSLYSAYESLGILGVDERD